MGNYYLYKMGKFFAEVLPFKISYALVVFICDLHFYLSKKDRLAVRNNLKIVLEINHVPDAQIRAVFRNFGVYLLEFFTMTKRLQPGYIESHIHIDHIEYLNEVLERGNGAILVSAHLGNWEMGGAVLPLLGYSLSVVALAHKDPRVNALFNAQREIFGAQVIQTDMAVRRVIENLKQNRLVAILGDRDFGNHGLMMDFLGQPSLIPKGAAYFSLKTGTPIIPVFFLRTADNHFKINVYPPITPPHCPGGKLKNEFIIEYMQKYLTIIENEIRKNPTQWLLFREVGP